MQEAIEEAQQRTGVKAIIISTPSFPVKADTPEKGFDMGEVEQDLRGAGEVRRHLLHAAPVHDRRHAGSLHPQAPQDGPALGRHPRATA